MYVPSRDQARRFFFDTWRKYQVGEPLSSLESIALDVMLLHPEYQGMVSDPERNVDRDYSPESGAINPFLHMSLHLAIEEQLSIDQPPGIRAECERLCALLSSAHEAKHAILECLGETLWHAQRNGVPPDQAKYLECLRRKPVR